MGYHRYKPRDKAHITDDPSEEGRTLCGLAHEGDVRDVDDDPNTVLPKYIEYCYRCRAAYVTRVIEELDTDRASLDEGDVVEYWTHDDPTDASSTLCIRKEGVIVETPPWDLRHGDRTTTVTGSYRVQQGAITYTSVSPKRIWRINHRPADDVLDESALENSLKNAMSTAYGVDND